MLIEILYFTMISQIDLKLPHRNNYVKQSYIVYFFNRFRLFTLKKTTEMFEIDALNPIFC